MNFTEKELNRIALAVSFSEEAEKKLRKIVFKNQAFLVLLGVGLFLFFFAVLTIVMIIWYILSINQVTQLIILPIVCLIVLLFALALLFLVVLPMFSGQPRRSLKRNLPKKEKIIFLGEKVTKKLKKPVIIYDGEYY